MSVIHLTTENFETEVSETRVPVLVDFWASWCGPCQMMASVVDETAREMGESAKVCKVNIDEQSDLAEQYQVESIPTFILFKDGKEIDRRIGAMEKSQLMKIFDVE